jgi:2',3'-cyclic-nucleotide 2'-phosphodiesterase (5'-nucleotidase family)
MKLTVPLLLSLLWLKASCDELLDGRDIPEIILQQPVAAAPPLADDNDIRELTWGQLNFLHTTDTHGWLPGHLLEPQFSADLGDYVSFIHHMKQQAATREVDLLVVDSGDRHDGNGLSDATTPDGEISERVFMNVDFDIITIGNHELYKAEVAVQEYELVRPHYGEKYVVSNVDILVDDEWVQMGEKYRVFQTENQQLNVLAFAFLFDFKLNAKNTKVTMVKDAVQEEWFQEALKIPDIDVIVLAGHIPPRFFTETETIVRAIREVLPDVPIQGLGGHSHIRDYRIYDHRAVALQSGRFMETIGWASIKNVGPGSDPEFDLSPSRSYIDFNLQTLTHHSKTTANVSIVSEENPFFHTEKGIWLSQQIADYRQELNLNEFITCIPQNYFTNRAKYPGKNNVFTLLQNEVLPLLSSPDYPDREDGPRFIIANTGSIRFDLFKGPFTRDTGFSISPFNNQWLYIPSVDINIAKRILPLLNQQDQILPVMMRLARIFRLASQGKEFDREYVELGPPDCRGHLEEVESWKSEDYWFEDEDDDSHYPSDTTQHSLKVKHKSFGYVTYDDLGHNGDDTEHKAWPYSLLPNAVQTEQNILPTTTHVDVIFFDFLKPFVEDTLKELCHDDLTDFIDHYSNETVIELFPKYFKTLDLEC